jgi:ElaB/YqjD/DUF883 family membrane-anchored ribosome-binding protein
MDTKVRDSLDHVRASAQELHGAISDAAAKHGGAIKADLEAVGKKAKTVMESVKSSVGARSTAAKKDLKEAVTHLEAVQKHAAAGLKSSGQAFQASVRQTLAEARASVQKLSEAVAADRAAESTTTRK